MSDEREDAPADAETAGEVLVACAHRDQARVERLVEGLRRAGFAAWWERDLDAGEPWRPALEARLETAGCVVVVWSEASVGAGGELVQDVAARAMERGVLVPVHVDKVIPPLGLRQVRSLDLIAWNGSRRSRRFRRVAAAVRAKLAGAAPLPRPRGRLVRWLGALGGLAGLLVLLGSALGTASDLVGLGELLCGAPGVHALCRARGWGGVATAAEDALWAERPEGDCEALRHYLARFPAGAYAEEAERRLQAAQTVPEERWVPGDQPLPLFVGKSPDPFPTEEAARADARARATNKARELCDLYEHSGEHRVVGVEVPSRGWDCESRNRGVVCGFDGRITCRFEVRQRILREVCQ